MAHSALYGMTNGRTHFYPQSPLVFYGFMLFAWLFVTCVSCDLALAQRRTALVIGNAAYGELGVLRNSANDATDIAAVLRQLGFEVTLLRDVDRRAMFEAIDAFSVQLRRGGAGLFYYAGHGLQVQGENYLIPLQARISREQDIPYEAVPVGRVLGGMEDARNQLNLIILDACRDNPYARQWRSAQRGLAVVQAVQGSLIAYATAPGAVASDGDGRNGLYTSHLLKHLSTPGLSVEHLFKYVRTGVVKATKGKQTPWESSSLIGDFFFVTQSPISLPAGSSPPMPPATVTPVPTGPDPEAVMWSMVEHTTHPEDLTAFLKAYPNGRFAPAARLKLQQLQRVATQQQSKEEQRQAEQERQRQERAAAAVQQQREEERKRLEDTKRREAEAQKASPGTTTTTSQTARLEPDNKLRQRTSVAVPSATISGRNAITGDWSSKVPDFHIDRQPVSNKEFLDFVKANPQWKKSQISQHLHDGDYLKHWAGDEVGSAAELERPVLYVSYFAAEAYCKSQGKKVPWLNHYRIATNFLEHSSMSISYEATYTAPNLNLVKTEWTNSMWGASTPDSGKRIKYQYQTVHNFNPKDSNYTPEEDKRFTGRSLGFRCAQY